MEDSRRGVEEFSTELDCKEEDTAGTPVAGRTGPTEPVLGVEDVGRDVMGDAVVVHGGKGERPSEILAESSNAQAKEGSL